MSERSFSQTITLFLRVNNPEFGVMHLAKDTAKDSEGGVRLRDNLENLHLKNWFRDPAKEMLVEYLLGGWFNLPQGCPQDFFSKKNVGKGTVVGVVLRPIDREILEIWIPITADSHNPRSGIKLWGF